MSFILKRSRINERQTYMDSFRKDVDGFWRDPLAPHDGINLPKQFRTEHEAEMYMGWEREIDPSWHYETDYYE